MPRPFSSVKEMDETLIRNWNETVTDDDTIYVLGDISMKIQKYDLNVLKGRIHVILGNHDKRPNYFKQFTHILSIQDRKYIDVEGQIIVLDHFPLHRWDRSHYGSWHLFGHCHGRLTDGVGKSLDVGVDSWQYRPVSFVNIKAAMRHKPDNPNLIKVNNVTGS